MASPKSMNRSRSRSPVGRNDIDTITQLINEREDHRAKKDWKAADAVRSQLKEQFAVSLFDKHKYWLDSDGKRHNIGETPVQTEENWITDLVDRRELARKGKDFSQADELRNQLKEKGVNVYDKEKVWLADGQMGLIPRWDGDSDNLKAPTRVPLEGVVMLVKERENYRSQKDWAVSDKIRDLLKSIGVTFQDKQGTYKMDGGVGLIADLVSSGGRGSDRGSNMGGSSILGGNPNMGGGGGNHNMPQMGGGNPYMNIAQMYGGNPNIDPQQLHQQMGNQSFDWMSTNNPYGNIGNWGTQHEAKAMTPSHPAQPQSVAALVRSREQARYDKNFKLADMVRDQLKNMGVQVYDKEKRWESTDGQSGTVPTYAEILGQTPRANQ